MTKGSYKLLGISERLSCNTWCIMDVIWTFNFASKVLTVVGVFHSKSDSSHTLAWSALGDLMRLDHVSVQIHCI